MQFTSYILALFLSTGLHGHHTQYPYSAILSMRGPILCFLLILFSRCSEVYSFSTFANSACSAHSEVTHDAVVHVEESMFVHNNM